MRRYSGTTRVRFDIRRNNAIQPVCYRTHNHTKAFDCKTEIYQIFQHNGGRGAALAARFVCTVRCSWRVLAVSERAKTGIKLNCD